MAYKTYSMELAGRTLSIDIGRVAKQANGAALMHYGDTTVLCTATASEKPREGIDFFPLSVEFEEKMYIIDQHAAHERVLYEKTLKSMQTREFTSQMISPPIVLNLSMREAELLNTYMDRFTRIGFEIEEFGQDSYAVRAVPDNLFSIAKKELLIQMLDSLSDEIARNQSPDLIDEKIASMSCKAAVKGNMKLSVQEVDALIGELLSLDNPYHCPHGRPTIIAMTKRELEKKFKRII